MHDNEISSLREILAINKQLHDNEISSLRENLAINKQFHDNADLSRQKDLEANKVFTLQKLASDKELLQASIQAEKTLFIEKLEKITDKLK